MHLITVTRPSCGRWQTGVWLVDGFVTDDLVLDQLPYFIGGLGGFTCPHPYCASQNLAQTMTDWSPAPNLEVGDSAL